VLDFAKVLDFANFLQCGGIQQFGELRGGARPAEGGQLTAGGTEIRREVRGMAEVPQRAVDVGSRGGREAESAASDFDQFGEGCVLGLQRSSPPGDVGLDAKLIESRDEVFEAGTVRACDAVEALP
jgi:hypothetical protein